MAIKVSSGWKWPFVSQIDWFLKGFPAGYDGHILQKINIISVGYIANVI